MKKLRPLKNSLGHYGVPKILHIPKGKKGTKEMKIYYWGYGGEPTKNWENQFKIAKNLSVVDCILLNHVPVSSTMICCPHAHFSFTLQWYEIKTEHPLINFVFTEKNKINSSCPCI